MSREALGQARRAAAARRRARAETGIQRRRGRARRALARRAPPSPGEAVGTASGPTRRVAQHAPMRKQSAVLLHVSQAPTEFDRVLLSYVDAVHLNQAQGLDQPVEASQQGGLPGPAFADQRQRVPGRHVDRDVVERHDRREAMHNIPSGERNRHPEERDEGEIQVVSEPGDVTISHMRTAAGAEARNRFAPGSTPLYFRGSPARHWR